jgi:integrative and conjugative element protein (TIGR02256 family)
LSVMVSHDCSIGAATLALPGANGAGVDILRRLAVTASEDDELADFLDAFHPDLPRTGRFLPEPGCSDPTYVGSAADLTAFAAWLLNDALTVLGMAPHETAPKRWATVVRSPSAGRPRLASQRRHWPEPLLRADQQHGYQIRLDRTALADVRREVTRMAGRRSPDVETGGLLLGQIDHASRVVWVTEAQGLPAGSEAAAEGLRLDPSAARAEVDGRLFRTRRLVGFIGAWHTHPRHAAVPSTTDDHAMREMADANGAPVLMMIFGADRDSRGRPNWSASLYFPT